MGTPIGEDEVLNPGDLLDVIYEVKPGNDTLVDLAISKAKNDLAKDPRWHYQGSHWEEYPDPDFAGTVRLIVFTVQVADPSKVTGEDPPDVQLARALDPRIIAAVILAVGLAISSVAASIYMTYKGYLINKTASDPGISDEVKLAALAGLTKSNLGDALKSVGHSLVIVALIVGVLWVLSKSGLIERVRSAPAA